MSNSYKLEQSTRQRVASLEHRFLLWVERESPSFLTGLTVTDPGGVERCSHGFRCLYTREEQNLSLSLFSHRSHLHWFHSPPVLSLAVCIDQERLQAGLEIHSGFHSH